MSLHTGPSLAALMSLPRVGSARANALASHFCTWDDLRTATVEDLSPVVGTATARHVHPLLADVPPVPDLPTGMRVVSRYDPDYPTRLRDLVDPPLLLWVLGTLPPETPTVAIVGTRTPNPLGARAARVIATSAAERGIATVSGLAFGVDSMGHEACLAAGLPTWAVLGQGLGARLDATRDRLATRILGAGGGLVAEVSPPTPAAPRLLVARNRLQSGLTDATVIAQTGLPGDGKPAGTIHTARFALQQHRPLVVLRPVAPYDTDPAMSGNAALTDPHGMDPALLHIVDPGLAEAVAARRPVADHVITDRRDLPAVWDSLRPRP